MYRVNGCESELRKMSSLGFQKGRDVASRQPKTWSRIPNQTQIATNNHHQLLFISIKCYELLDLFLLKAIIRYFISY